MVPVMSALGLGTMAVVVGTLFGPSQVLSRLINMVFGESLSQVMLAIICAILLPAALVILIATAPSVPGALAFAVVFGLGSGLNSIVYGTLPLALFGSDGYGRRQGQIMSARLVVSSMAPFALAFLMGNLGISWSLSIAALLSTIAVAAFSAIMRLARPVARSETVPNPGEA
jgi:hypothetical protein